MAEYDVFADIINRFGEPADATTISAEEAARYYGRVPEALVRFWQEHGRGSYSNKMFTICDPKDFGEIRTKIFKGDLE